jgi:hypothetical protein
MAGMNEFIVAWFGWVLAGGGWSNASKVLLKWTDGLDGKGCGSFDTISDCRLPSFIFCQTGSDHFGTGLLVQLTIKMLL